MEWLLVAVLIVLFAAVNIGWILYQTLPIDREMNKIAEQMDENDEEIVWIIWS